jgi:RHS repeat-associated protein
MVVTKSCGCLPLAWKPNGLRTSDFGDLNDLAGESSVSQAWPRFMIREGKRIKKVVPETSETTVFVYSAGKLIAEYSTASPPTNPTTSYTTTDHLGSPRVITDATGYVTSRRDFLPFGEELTINVGGRTTALKYGMQDGVRQKFTGYQKDTETSLDFAEARMYENRFGRFTAVDPLTSSGKSSNPKTFNRYVYAGQNPIIITDRFGLEWYKNKQTGKYNWYENGKFKYDDEKGSLDDNWEKVSVDGSGSASYEAQNADNQKQFVSLNGNGTWNWGGLVDGNYHSSPGALGNLLTTPTLSDIGTNLFSGSGQALQGHSLSPFVTCALCFTKPDAVNVNVSLFWFFSITGTHTKDGHVFASFDGAQGLSSMLSGAILNYKEVLANPGKNSFGGFLKDSGKIGAFSGNVTFSNLLQQNATTADRDAAYGGHSFAGSGGLGGVVMGFQRSGNKTILQYGVGSSGISIGPTRAWYVANTPIRWP